MRGTVSTLTLALGLLGASAPAQEVNKRDFQESRKQYHKAEELLQREDLEGAVSRLRRAIELDPGFVLARYGLGQTLMRLKRYPEALEAYGACKDTILRQGSLDQKQRAELDRQRRDEIRELEDSLQRLRAGKIKSASPGAEVGIEERLRLLRQADLRGAEQRVTVPAELSLGIGSAHFRLGRLDEARRSYEDAIRADASLGAAHNNLAVIYMLTGRYAESRREIEAAEKAGFNVHPQLKKDLEARAAAPPRKDP